MLMDTKILLESKQLTKDEIQALLKVIWTLQKKAFPEKEISIFVIAPDLLTMNHLLTSKEPPFRLGQMVFTNTK